MYKPENPKGSITDGVEALRRRFNRLSIRHACQGLSDDISNHASDGTDEPYNIHGLTSDIIMSDTFQKEQRVITRGIGQSFEVLTPN